ncbi:MAG: tRNA lysidine(34) synthetase TilS [Deltaproteobacteria bacterium]|nr:tRNA lysidine(34) synthetase TilS [Deltaproteobacteria bacterium]
MTELIHNLRQALEEIGVEAGQRILVACSGGPDSVALLDLLARLAPQMGLFVSVASFNHGLRPAAAEEVELAARLAAERGLAFIEGRASTADYPPAGPSQEAARELRLAFLERARGQTGADWIALGHSADDQAETLLMRLIRGAGLTGLAAIPPRRGRLIRPLLQTGRGEIRAYLENRGLPFVEDPSNRDPAYLRVRVRHDLLPRLAQENPRIVGALARLADLARAEEEVMARLADQELARLSLSSPEGGVLVLDAAPLAGLPLGLRRRVIRAALALVKGDLRCFSAEHVDQAAALAARPGAGVSLPAGLVARHESGQLVISPAQTPASLQSLRLEEPGRYDLGHGLAMTLEEVPPPDPAALKLAADPNTALLDARVVIWPLTVRPPRPGDRIKPLGLAGSKKLSDLFIDKKVPRRWRGLVPILVSGEEVIWAGGLCLSRLAAVGPQTKAALRVRLELQTT